MTQPDPAGMRDRRSARRRRAPGKFGEEIMRVETIALHRDEQIPGGAPLRLSVETRSNATLSSPINRWRTGSARRLRAT